MYEELTLTKSDPDEVWGFRLTGGRDFGIPLTVLRMVGGSIAEQCGICVGDMIVSINGKPANQYTHTEAQREIHDSGNHLHFTVLRGSPVVPLPLTPLRGNTPALIYALTDGQIESSPQVHLGHQQAETIPEGLLQNCLSGHDAVTGEYATQNGGFCRDKGEDEHKPDMTDDEIAELLSGESELLDVPAKPNAAVLGINFQKFIPRVEFIKDSEVFKVLQSEQLHKELSEEEQLAKNQYQRFSTFLTPRSSPTSRHSPDPWPVWKCPKPLRSSWCFPDSYKEKKTPAEKNEEQIATAFFTRKLGRVYLSPVPFEGAETNSIEPSSEYLAVPNYRQIVAQIKPQEEVVTDTCLSLSQSNMDATKQNSGSIENKIEAVQKEAVISEEILTIKNDDEGRFIEDAVESRDIKEPVQSSNEAASRIDEKENEVDKEWKKKQIEETEISDDNSNVELVENYTNFIHSDTYIGDGRERETNMFQDKTSNYKENTKLMSDESYEDNTKLNVNQSSKVLNHLKIIGGVVDRFDRKQIIYEDEAMRCSESDINLNNLITLHFGQNYNIHSEKQVEISDYISANPSGNVDAIHTGCFDVLEPSHPQNETVSEIFESKDASECEIISQDVNNGNAEEIKKEIQETSHCEECVEVKSTERTNEVTQSVCSAETCQSISFSQFDAKHASQSNLREEVYEICQALPKEQVKFTLTPQMRPVVLPGGRQWRQPKDAANEEMYNETLIAQAEVLVGSTIGVNFRKYIPPKFDMSHSDVYRLIHEIESNTKGIAERPEKVSAEEDYYQQPINKRHFYAATLPAMPHYTIGPIQPGE